MTTAAIFLQAGGASAVPQLLLLGGMILVFWLAAMTINGENNRVMSLIIGNFAKVR